MYSTRIFFLGSKQILLHFNKYTHDNESPKDIQFDTFRVDHVSKVIGSGMNPKSLSECIWLWVESRINRMRERLPLFLLFPWNTLGFVCLSEYKFNGPGLNSLDKTKGRRSFGKITETDTETRVHFKGNIRKFKQNQIKEKGRQVMHPVQVWVKGKTWC